MKKQLFLSAALLVASQALPAMQPAMNFNGPAKLITNYKGSAKRVLLPDGRTIELDPSKNWVMKNGILQEAGKPAIQVQNFQNKPAAPAVAQAAIRKTTCANGACSIKKPAAKPASGCATGTCSIKPMRMTCSNGKCGAKK